MKSWDRRFIYLDTRAFNLRPDETVGASRNVLCIYICRQAHKGGGGETSIRRATRTFFHNYVTLCRRFSDKLLLNRYIIAEETGT